MAEYKTRQKELLYSFLSENCERGFTVEELCQKLYRKEGENAPAKSTVYRLITRLVTDGTVKKMLSEDGKNFVYQIVAGEHCESHLHLKCNTCGRIIHMKETVSDELLRAIKASDDFSVNEKATIIFGLCSRCK